MYVKHSEHRTVELIDIYTVYMHPAKADIKPEPSGACSGVVARAQMLFTTIHVSGYPQGKLGMVQLPSNLAMVHSPVSNQTR